MRSGKVVVLCYLCSSLPVVSLPSLSLSVIVSQCSLFMHLCTGARVRHDELWECVFPKQVIRALPAKESLLGLLLLGHLIKPVSFLL